MGIANSTVSIAFLDAFYNGEITHKVQMGDLPITQLIWHEKAIYAVSTKDQYEYLYTWIVPPQDQCRKTSTISCSLPLKYIQLFPRYILYHLFDQARPFLLFLDSSRTKDLVLENDFVCAALSPNEAFLFLLERRQTTEDILRNYERLIPYGFEYTDFLSEVNRHPYTYHSLLPLSSANSKLQLAAGHPPHNLKSYGVTFYDVLTNIPHQNGFAFGTLYKDDSIGKFFLVRINHTFSDEKNATISYPKTQLEISTFKIIDPALRTSPDGQLLALYDGGTYNAHLFSLHDPRPIIKPVINLEGTNPQWCPGNSRYIALVCWHETHKREVLQILDLLSGECIAELDPSSLAHLDTEIASYCWSVCGTQLAIAFKNKIIIWEVKHIFMPTIQELIKRELCGTTFPSMHPGPVFLPPLEDKSASLLTRIINQCRIS